MNEVRISNTIKDVILIALLSAILFGAFLGKYPLQSPDSARYAEIPREMIVTGDFITPHLNGIKYFEKPPFFYWIQAVSLKVFGINEFAVGLPNALFAFATCLLVYFAGKKLYQRQAGLWASVVLATNILFFSMARIVTLDMALTFFLSAALFCFFWGTRESPGLKHNIYFWLFYVFAAFATLTKGLIGIFLPLAIIFLYVLFYNEWRNIKTYKIISGGILFLLITAPWHILVQISNPEFFHFYFIKQHFLRYLTPYAKREQEWWFLPIVLLLGFYPWIFFLLQSLKINLASITWKNLKTIWQNYQLRPLVFLIIWIFFIYLFFSFSSSQLIPYILPIFPPLSIIVGNYLARMCSQSNSNFGLDLGFKLITFGNFILGITIIIAINFMLDFKQEIYSPVRFYEVAAIVIVCGFLIYYFYRKHGINAGFVVIAFTMAIFLLSINPFLPIMNHRSIKPLAIELKAKLNPSDEVINFQDYYQDLPFYLERTVTLVNYAGELEFGIKHMDASKWVINTNEFWHRWYSDKKIYMITSSENYKQLQDAINKTIGPRSKMPNVVARYNRLFLVKTYFGDVLLTNKK